MDHISVHDQDGIDKVRKLQAAKADARCDSCGCNWEIHRGDSFLCPYCAATFDTIHVNIGGTYLQCEGVGGSTNA